jgi:hypothetical protein
MHRLTSRLLPAIALAALTVPSSGQAITTVQVASGLTRPVHIVSPPDDDRQFIVERGGRVKILSGGSVLGTPFLNISAKVLASGSLFGEQGLLSLAFHPQYATNGLFVVYYVNTAGNTVLERYTVSANPNVADATSTCTLKTISQPFANHNGGHVAFGPDGMLYLSLGDGGSGNDPNCRAQNLTVDKGSMLRFELNTASCGLTIPPDNPFTGAGATNQVWHYGLRNPWRFSFDRITGDMYIGDVGQDAREEISFAPAGVGGINFGWRVMEGNLCNGLGTCPGGTPACFDAAYTNPIHTYNHPGAGVCSITGGVVYRGCAIPDLQGTYFLADVCSDQIWSFEYDGVTKTNFMDRTAQLDPPGTASISRVVSFGEDRYGEIYIVELNGEIWKIVPDGAVAGADCDLNAQIDSCEIASGYVTDFDSNTVPDVCDPLAENRNMVPPGESVQFTLNAGVAEAGKFYWVLGSFSGTSPGITFPGGATVPVNFDAYTKITIFKPFAGIFTTFLGVLDGNGEAAASFNVPPGLDPDLIGLTLYHAFAASPTFGDADYASNAVPFTLTL